MILLLTVIVSFRYPNRACCQAMASTDLTAAAAAAAPVRRWKRELVAVGEGNQGQANKAKVKLAKWIPVPEEGMFLCVERSI